LDYTIFKNSVQAMINPIINVQDYAHIHHPISRDLDIHYPVNYYLDLSPKIDYKGKFDSSGVFLHYINKHNGWQYYPITIFNYGIGSYQNYLMTKKQIYFEQLLNQVRWACQNQVREGRFCGAWIFQNDLKTYELKANWISAMSQGLGISLLLRSWILTKESVYFETAKKAFQPFLKEVKDGGVQAKFHSRFLFFEEYPSTPPSFVLNGFVSSMLGLRDLYLFTNDSKALVLWNSGIDSLKHMLLYYDSGYWSNYDLRKDQVNIASPFYHRLHIVHLRLLYLLTNETIFQKYSKRFEQYLKNPKYRCKAIIKKIFWRLRRL